MVSSALGKECISFRIQLLRYLKSEEKDRACHSYGLVQNRKKGFFDGHIVLSLIISLKYFHTSSYNAREII